MLALPKRLEKPWQPSQNYQIKQGDTIIDILTRHGWSTKQIDEFALVGQVARENGITDPNQISVGQNLTIPEAAKLKTRPK